MIGCRCRHARPARLFARRRNPGREPSAISLLWGDLSRSVTLADRAHYPWQELLTWYALPAHCRGNWLEFQLSGARWCPLRHNSPERFPDGPPGGQGSVFGRRARPFGTHSGQPAARLRLFLQRRGDNWTGVGAHEFYRWWSVDNVVLATGEHELIAPLVPDQWFSVFGKRGDDPAAAGQFAAAVADPQAVGQTFGGMFAGHGVFAVAGPSRFTLKRYEVA